MGGDGGGEIAHHTPSDYTHNLSDILAIQEDDMDTPLHRDPPQAGATGPLTIELHQVEASLATAASRITLPPEIVELRRVFGEAERELKKVIVGMDELLTLTLASAFISRHVLLLGETGLAKTLLAKNIAQVLGLKFGRTQGTPDLMPQDITGGIVKEGDSFVFMPGPVFTNVYMADEINRTPPKTQSALFEAMQEKQVTSGGMTHPIHGSFWVIATQNETGTLGTYPLPTAQMDRFAMRLTVPFPSKDEYLEIMRRNTNGYKYEINSVISAEDAASQIEIFHDAVYGLSISEPLERKCIELICALIPGSDNCLRDAGERLKPQPLVRALDDMVVLAKVLAALDGRMTVSEEDIKRVAIPCLSHRLCVKSAREAAGVSLDSLVEQAIAQTFPSD